MPGNDFEKQVQQKMDELQFVPSDAVWPAVEREIAQKKKRRFVIWLPLLLLLMGGACWLYFFNGITGSNKKPTDTASTAATKKSTAIVDAKQTVPVNGADKNNAQAVSSNHNTVVAPVTAEPRVAAVKNTADKNTSLGNTRPAIDKSKMTASPVGSKINTTVGTEVSNDGVTASNAVIAKQGRYTNKKANNKGQKLAGSKNSSKLAAKEDAGAEKEPVPAEVAAIAKKEDQSASTVGNTQTAIAGAPEAAVAMPLADSIAADDALAAAKLVAKDSAQSVGRPDSSKAIAANKKNNNAKKIEWGASVQAGASNISNGFSGIFSGTQTLDARSFSNLQSNPTNVNNNNSGATAVAPPSDVHTGFAYGLGVFIRKPLGKGYSLLAGVNYNYYSTTMRVGAKIDTGANAGQYRTGSASKYTNKFHFIELPVIVQKQLGNKSRFAVNGGFSLSILVGNKVLLYDAQKINYGGDNSGMNKMQLNLLAGCSYRFFPKTIPLEIGPQFSYGISNIYKKEVYGSRHLFFTGLQARVFFGKK